MDSHAAPCGQLARVSCRELPRLVSAAKQWRLADVQRLKNGGCRLLLQRDDGLTIAVRCESFEVIQDVPRFP